MTPPSPSGQDRSEKASDGLRAPKREVVQRHRSFIERPKPLNLLSLASSCHPVHHIHCVHRILKPSEKEGPVQTDGQTPMKGVSGRAARWSRVYCGSQANDVMAKGAML